MVRHAGEDVFERADPQFIVRRYGDMVLPALTGSQAHVAAHAARDLVAEGSEPARKVLPRDVARQLHGSIVSSRTTFTNRSLMLVGGSHSSQ